MPRCRRRRALIDVSAVVAERAAMWAPLAEEQEVGIEVVDRGGGDGGGRARGARPDPRQLPRQRHRRGPGSRARSRSSSTRSHRGGHRGYTSSTVVPGLPDDQLAHAFDRFWRVAGRQPRRLGNRPGHRRPPRRQQRRHRHPRTAAPAAASTPMSPCPAAKTRRRSFRLRHLVTPRWGVTARNDALQAVLRIAGRQHGAIGVGQARRARAGRPRSALRGARWPTGNRGTNRLGGPGVSSNMAPTAAGGLARPRRRSVGQPRGRRCAPRPRSVRTRSTPVHHTAWESPQVAEPAAPSTPPPRLAP